ncbi:hypothetical protein MMC13_001555 [Lambiella insularis]|nr:hypothetical protein [Lambiella insularis]
MKTIHLSDTSTQELQDQFTLPTSPSAYGASNTRFKHDDGSPTKARPQRPGPPPVQSHEEDAGSQSRGRSLLQFTLQDGSRLRDTSVQSWISIERSRSRIKSEGKQSNESAAPSSKMKTQNISADLYGIQNSTFSTVGGSKFELQASGVLINIRDKLTKLLDWTFIVV